MNALRALFALLTPVSLLLCPLAAAAQSLDVRSPELVIPPTLMIPVPDRLKSLFPKGLVPGMGFGLSCAMGQAGGDMLLHTVTGRGPVLHGPTVLPDALPKPLEAPAASSIFVLPEFTPSIVTLRLTGAKAEVAAVLALKNEDGAPMRGLPPHPVVTGSPVEVPLDLDRKPLNFDKDGIDPQGVAFDPRRNAFWLADGYRPALARIAPRDGRVMALYAAGDALEPYLATRRVGMGFCGVSVSPGGKIVTIMRGVLSVGGVPATFTRIVELDPETDRVRQIPYPIESDIFPDPSRVFTSEPVAYAEKRALVLEQGIDKDGKYRSLVFAADLTQAHNVSRVFNEQGQPTEVIRDKAQQRKLQLNVARKTLVLDLHEAGFKAPMAESMTLLSDGRTLAFMSGHGFGLEAIISGYPVDLSGKPILDPARYQLGKGGALTVDGKESQAQFSLRPTTEVPRLWVAMLPKKVTEY